MRIAVLSDIHAAADQLNEALGQCRAEGFDRLVLLGDLFTYGPRPEHTLDLVRQSIERDDTILISGNHDQVYFDLLRGHHSDYFDKLPDWIRESIEWTVERIAPLNLEGIFDWRREWQEKGFLFAHANPFGYGDWRYIADEALAAQAAAILADRDVQLGVFGHVHRYRCYQSDGTTVLTVGSIGQPRDRAAMSPEWTMIDLDQQGLRIKRKIMWGDWSGHVAELMATSLSEPTRNRLAGLFK